MFKIEFFFAPKAVPLGKAGLPQNSFWPAGVLFSLTLCQRRSFPAPRILVVDDDPGQRSLLESFLRSQHFEVVLADSGERALALLPGGNFAMMISDVRMPGLSGLETLRRVRPQFPALPVLLVTAYADIRDAVVAMRDGALNYLAKPIDLDELLATVRQATGTMRRWPLDLAAEKPLPPEVIAQSPLTARPVSGSGAGGPLGGAGAHHRRKRHRQGSRRGCHPRLERARQGPA